MAIFKILKGGLASADEDTTDIWQNYQAGRDHHNREDMYRKTEKCHRFYEGDQWNGTKTGGETLPVMNFIKPICRYKIATVAMNDTAIIYSAMDGDALAKATCDLLTAFAGRMWEKGKLDRKKWEIVKAACIAGDEYVYCYDARKASGSVADDRTPVIETQLIGRTNVYLSDEQNPDLNEQEWIIISERRSVDAVRREAKENGVKAEDIERISPDEADETQVGFTGSDEVDTENGKCTSLLYMEKRDDGLHFSRSVREVVYQPDQTITGLDIYPVACMRWEETEGSARGIGVVESLIPNQIEVNRTMARRAVCVKRYSFPTLVYDNDKISNPEDLGKVGASVAVKNLQGNPMSTVVQYLTPVAISTDAERLQNEIVTMSRELEGASDAATGQVDPTKTSGEAIKAARDQSAMAMTEQSSSWKQFVEDLALIWYRLWCAYSPDGLVMEGMNEQSGKVEQAVIPAEQLADLDIDIKIDISPIDPYSVLSREAALENALQRQEITFEEYVSALDANSGVPKEKFEKILADRKMQQMQTGAAPAQQPAQVAQQPDAGAQTAGM